MTPQLFRQDEHCSDTVRCDHDVRHPNKRTLRVTSQTLFLLVRNHLVHVLAGGSHEPRLPKMVAQNLRFQRGGGEHAQLMPTCHVCNPFQTSTIAAATVVCRSRIMARLSTQLVQNADSLIRVALRSARPPNARGNEVMFFTVSLHHPRAS